MPPWINFSLGRRRLRRGDKGEDVRRLQERLASLGYDVGEIDGRFGYLTEDALIEFQRDHRLRVDKIAGPRVMAALAAAAPQRRIVHEVRPGERLSDLAQKYGLAVDAIRWMNHLPSRPRLVAGQRLVLRSSLVLAGLPRNAGPQAERTLVAQRRTLSGVALGGLVTGPGGELEGSLDPALAELAKRQRWRLTALVMHGEKEDESDLAGALARRKARRRFFAGLKERWEQKEFGALLLDVGTLAPGWGRPLREGLIQLKREFPQLPVTVALGPLGEGWRGWLVDLDDARVAECADHFLLALHRWECLLGKGGETPGRDRMEKWVARATRLIPPWKVILGIPMGACRVSDRPQEVGYRAAVTAALSCRVRPKADANGFLRFRLDEGDERGEYVLMGREPFARMLALAYRYRLAGVYLWPAGLEDRRFWDMVVRRLWAERG